MNQYLNTSTSFIIVIMFTPMIIFSSKSFIMLWIMLEMNNMAFIYLFVLNEKTTPHMTMKFFLIQSISSLSIIIFIMLNHNTYQELIISKMNMFLMMGLLLKMSLPPFHTWMIKLSKTASWNMIILFITWQKTIPIFIMMKIENSLMILMSLTFLVMGTILQLMFSKIKLLITTSSITHMGWMIIPQNMYKMFPMFYLLIYSMIIIPLIFFFKKSNKWKLMKKEQKSNIELMMHIFNLSSIPPLTGFILKWIMFSILILQNTNTMLMLCLFIISTISFYIYFQIMYNTTIKNFTIQKYKTTTHSKPNNIFLLATLILPLLFIM